MDALKLIRENIFTRTFDAFLFYELSQLYDDKEIEQQCLENLRDPLLALETPYFLDVSPKTVCTVYKSNSVKSVAGTKKLVDKLELYIETNKKTNPEIVSQVENALKGIHFMELEAIDILKTSLLASSMKLILVSSKLNMDQRYAAHPSSLDVYKLSVYDQQEIKGKTLAPVEFSFQ